MAALEGADGEVLSEGRLANAGLGAEENVLAAANEVEGGMESLVEARDRSM